MLHKKEEEEEEKSFFSFQAFCDLFLICNCVWKIE
jgi:hypothetical protein